MGERIFVRALGEVVAVNVRALGDDPQLAALDKNHDGYVKRHEVPDDDTWERVKATAGLYVNKPMPAMPVVAAVSGIAVVGLISRRIATGLARSAAADQAELQKSLSTSAQVAILSGVITFVKEASTCVAEENVSVLCFVDATATAGYAVASGSISATAGQVVGTATAAVTSPVITPIGGKIVGGIAGMSAGVSTQLTLDALKRRLVFKLSKVFDR